MSSAGSTVWKNPYLKLYSKPVEFVPVDFLAVAHVFLHTLDDLNLLKFMEFNVDLNVVGWVKADLILKLNFLHLVSV